MALQLWMGNAGSGKSYRLYQHVIEESGKHPELTYLMIVPEQFTLQTQHDLVMMHPLHGIMNIDVLSFARLAYRVFEEVGFSNAPGLLIDDMGKSLILRHLAEQYQDKLPVLGRNLKKLGYISEIKSVISEFMQYGIGDKELALLKEQAGAGNGRAMLNQKLTDIQLIYDAFRNYINEKYTTSEELLERVSSVLAESEKLKKSVLVFDGFTGFTPVQYKLIAAVLRHSVDVHVTILLDTGVEKPWNMNGEQELFYLSKKTVWELKKIARQEQIQEKPEIIIADSVPIRLTGHPMLIHLEKNLFRSKPECYSDSAGREAASASGTEIIASDNKITDVINIFLAATPEEEIRQTGIKILELVQKQKYRYQDIAIVSGDFSTYMHCVDRVFTKYEIPYFIDRTQPVLLNPFIEYLRALISILAEDYTYEGMFRYLKSGLTETAPEEIDRLENYVLACGIRGKKQWQARFIRKPASMESEELLELDEIRNKITGDFDVFYSEMKTVKDYANALYQFIVQQEINKKLKRYEEHFSVQGNSAKAKEYAQIYKQVMELLDKLVELLGDEEMSIKEFGELLDAGFDEIRIGVIPAGTDYVQFGDITRSRLREIKALFFVGVNDGIIPMNNGSGGIISDMDREYLSEVAEEITLAPSARMQAYTQRLYLYMLMTKPSERLYLSYAGMSESGNSLRPSYLIQTVRSMFPELAIEKPQTFGLSSKIWNKNAGYIELTGGLQPYITGTDEAFKQDYRELLAFYGKNTGHREMLEKLVQAAFYPGILKREDYISSAVASVLYGKVLVSSITRLESYARCAYQHFLTYGIGLKERELFQFEAKDMGMVFHDTLNIYADLLAEQGFTWQDVSPEQSELLVKEAVERCVARGEYAALYSNFRTRYMVERMLRITKRTVHVLTAQMKKGSFTPKSFELAFSAQNDYKSLNIKLSKEEELHLRGRIDRMDICEDNEAVYVKIIDYKSGNQSFDLAAVYEGLSLQLVVYLNAAMEMQGKLQEKETAPKQVVPAGILYYHIDDPLVEADREATEEDINQKIRNQLVMKGLVNSDEKVISLFDQEFEKSSDVIPVSRLKSGELSAKSSVCSTEDFQIISDYVNEKIKQMGTKILAGDVEQNPRDCTYCNYRTICHTEALEDVEELPKGTREEIIEKMKKDVPQIISREGSK